ncbi:MAG: signal peptidase I [Dehalococcoidia bacterium]|nr:signal peptidase I [Dehalococcoidia bacterium]
MKSNRGAYLLIGLLVGGYATLHFLTPGKIPGSTLGYVVVPLYWVMLAVIVHYLPPVSAAGKFGLRRELVTFGFMAGGFHVFLLLMGGVFSGFGNSPYSHQPDDVVRNIWVVAATLIGTEMVRARILCCLGKKWPSLVIGLVAVLFTSLDLAPSQFSQLTQMRSAVTFLGETIVPVLSINALASVLAYLGGAKPAIAYRGALLAFEWLSPVLPDLSWGITALLGVMVPALGVAAVQMLSSGRLRSVKNLPRETGESPVAGWIGGAVLVLALFWFSLGLLPVYPATVVTGSMTPLIKPGDVVIAAKVGVNEIEEGDIIDFRRGDIRVIHRVVAIEGTGETVEFVTKGDANKEEDSDRVIAAQLKGKMIGTVPAIGRLVLFLREAR